MAGRPASEPTVRAAGGVVTRRTARGSEFLVVHRPRYDDWSLPKGKLDPGEEFSTAAEREIAEETGSTAERLAGLGSVAYHASNGSSKLVRYWLFAHLSGEFRPNAEVDEIRWLTAAEMTRLLTYPRDRKVLAWGAALIDHPRAGRVQLVRHAQAGKRSKWRQADELRPLTKKGRRVAALISEQLTSTPVGRILSSPHTRCMQTVEPLGLALAEPVREDPSLAEGAPPDALMDRFGDLAGKAVVMCGHGAEIRAVLAQAHASGARLEPRPDRMPPKGGVWELELKAGEVTAGRLAAPPG